MKFWRAGRTRSRAYVVPEHAKSFEKRKRLEQAERAFAQASDLDPSQYQSSFNLGIVRLEMGDLEGAVGAFENALQVRPNLPEAWNNLGVAFQGLGQNRHAKRAFRRALKCNTRLGTDAALERIGVLINLGRLHKAQLQLARLTDAPQEQIWLFRQAIAQQLRENDSRTQLLELLEFLGLSKPRSKGALMPVSRMLLLGGSAVIAIALINEQDHSIVIESPQQLAPGELPAHGDQWTQLNLELQNFLAKHEIEEIPLIEEETVQALAKAEPAPAKEPSPADYLAGIPESSVYQLTLEDYAYQLTGTNASWMLGQSDLPNYFVAGIPSHLPPSAAERLAEKVSIPNPLANLGDAILPSLGMPSGLTSLVATAMMGQQKPTGDESYNIAIGPMKFDISASAKAIYNDNIALSGSNKKSDFILKSGIGIKGIYPVTDLNVIYLDVALGFQKYLSNSELDSEYFLIDPSFIFDPDLPTSNLQFEVFVDEFTFTFYNKFSLTQDAFDEAALSNLAQFTTFSDTLGMDVSWDLADVQVRSGISRNYYLVLDTPGFDYLNRHTDTAFTHVTGDVRPWLNVGLKGTASRSRFDDDVRNPGTTLTFGPTADIEVSKHIQISAELAINRSEFDNTDSKKNTYVGLFRIDHNLNKVMSHSASFSRSVIPAVGRNSNYQVMDRGNYNFEWQSSDQLAIKFDTTYLQGQEEGSDEFTRWDLGLGATYKLPPNMNFSLRLSHAVKDSEGGSGDYRRNLVETSFGYNF